MDVHCESFGVCKTYSAHEGRCVCNEDCPSYQDPVCTANGTTHDNKCLYELSYCRGLDNSTMYHPGSCEGRSSDTKRHSVCKINIPKAKKIEEGTAINLLLEKCMAII